VARLVETDQWLAVARWAHAHGCVMPELVKHGVWLKAAVTSSWALTPTP